MSERGIYDDWTDPDGWRTVVPADGPLLLVVNFEFGRGAAGFAELAKRLPDFRLLECLPPPSQSGVVGHDAFVRLLYRGAAEARRPIRGVLGYCAGAPLARMIADHLAGRGMPAVPVVVFDPITVDSHTLVGEFHTATASLLSRLEAEERAAIDAVARRWDSPGSPSEVVEVSTELATGYRRALAAACTRLPVAPAVQQQLATRFSAYLAYLVSAACAPPDAAPPTAVVMSDEFPEPPTGAFRRLRRDIPADRLLGDDRVATFVLETLTASVR